MVWEPDSCSMKMRLLLTKYGQCSEGTINSSRVGSSTGVIPLVSVLHLGDGEKGPQRSNASGRLHVNLPSQ